jgi:hypothetical protein
MTPSPGTIVRKAAAILRALRGRIRRRAMLALRTRKTRRQDMQNIHH